MKSMKITPKRPVQKSGYTSEIHFPDEEGTRTISTSDLPTFESESFFVQENRTNDKNRFEFKVHYAFEKSQNATLNDYYCANSRTVFKLNDSKLGEQKIKIIPIKDLKTTILVTSQYLDTKCNEERNKFDINPRQTDLVDVLSWEQINDNLRPIIKQALEKENPNLAKRNENEIKTIKDEHLHLTDYFDDLDSIGGAVDVDNVVRQAEKRFLDDKLDFKKESRKENQDSAHILKRASDLAGKELIEYVLMRDKIISQLESLHNESEDSEKIPHDLLLKTGINDSSHSPVPLNENNIWLLDDKFMSYSYVASEKTIRVTGREVGFDNESSYRPDISVFFQNQSDNHNAVIVELKGLGVGKNMKFSGLHDLREYAKTLRNQDGLDTIWYYLITKIDNDFEEDLLEDGYKQLFSTQDKTFFRHYENSGLNLYVMSSDTLIADAKARNKTFIDLVRSH